MLLQQSNHDTTTLENKRINAHVAKVVTKENQKETQDF